MQLPKHLDELSSFYRHSPYTIFKRITHLFLGILAIVVGINLWILSSESTQDWHDQQASQLGRSLSTYGADTLSFIGMQANVEEKVKLLNVLVNDPQIASVSLHDHHGTLMHALPDNESLIVAQRKDVRPPLVFVKEVIENDEVTGYLKLRMNRRTILSYHTDYQLQLFKQTQILMMLSALIAVIGTRAFYKWRIATNKTTG
jgi:membrane protein